MRENLHANIDYALAINRDEYFNKKQEELMKEKPLYIRRFRRLKKTEEDEREKRHKKLPKVEFCVCVDLLLYDIGFNNEIEKDELFKLYEDSEIEENEESEDDSYVINKNKAGKENDIIKNAKIMRVKYNNTSEDFLELHITH